jgi:hypothetical protein
MGHPQDSVRQGVSIPTVERPCRAAIGKATIWNGRPFPAHALPFAAESQLRTEVACMQCMQ